MNVKVKQCCLSFVVSLFLLPVLAENKTTIPVYQAGTRQITVNADQSSFYIRLASNPTTGYVLTLASIDTEKLKVLKHEFIPAKKSKKRLGAGGYAQWLIAAKQNFLAQQGKTHLIFHYGKPWQPDVYSTKAFTIISTTQLSR